MNKIIREVCLYIIDEHTISEAAEHFQKSISSIKKYLAVVRDSTKEDYDPVLAERLRLSQMKVSLRGVSKGGQVSKRPRNLTESERKKLANTYMSGQTYATLSSITRMPKSTLQENIRSIKDAEYQQRLDEYIKDTSWKR